MRGAIYIKSPVFIKFQDYAAIREKKVSIKI